MSRDNEQKNKSTNFKRKVNLNTEIKVPPHHHEHTEHLHHHTHIHKDQSVLHKSKWNLIIVAVIVIVIIAVGYIGYLRNGIGTLALTTEENDVVSVLYTGRLDTGEIFDTNDAKIAVANNITRSSFLPLQFKVGSGQMIKGFDTGVVGMKIGEKRNITIPPESAYGIYKSELVETIPLSNFTAAFPDVKNLTDGMRISFYYQGKPMSLAIKSFDKQYVTIDLNHPLAGKTLYFEVNIVNITKAQMR